MSDDYKSQLIDEWVEIYETYFGRDVYFSERLIPDWYDPDDHFAVLVPEDLTIDEVLDAVEGEFSIAWDTDFHSPRDLDYYNNSREASRDYCIIFENVEDAEDLSKTPEYDEYAKIYKKGITLLERLLLELYYYHYYDGNLDTNSYTGCGGTTPSNNYDNKVIAVSWNKRNDTMLIRLSKLYYSYEKVRIYFYLSR